MNSVNTLIEKINTAKSLDFGNIFTDSIELFKKTWLQGFLLQLFSIIVMLPLIIVLYVPMIGLVIAQQENGYDPKAFNAFFAGMSVLYIVFVVAAVIVLGTIAYALNAGFFRIMRKLDKGEQVSTSDFFHFVKAKHLSKVFMLMLVMILILIPSALLCYIPLIYVFVPISFFLIFFAFNPDLSVGEIVKVGFKLGNKKWLITFGLLVVSFVCYFILNLFTCGLGGLFLKSFLWHPVYIIYKEVIGFEETTAIDEIGISTE